MLTRARSPESFYFVYWSRRRRRRILQSFCFVRWLNKISKVWSSTRHQITPDKTTVRNLAVGIEPNPTTEKIRRANESDKFGRADIKSKLADRLDRMNRAQKQLGQWEELHTAISRLKFIDTLPVYFHLMPLYIYITITQLQSYKSKVMFCSRAHITVQLY